MKEHEIFTSAVVLGAGSSMRMGENKLLMKIKNQSVIERTLKTFDNCEKICEIVLVCRQEDFLEFSKICNALKTPTKIVNGGETRTHSALKGIDTCNENAQIIAIHDGARPLFTESIVNNAIDSAILNNAVIPVVPVKDTIKIVSNNIVQDTLNRDSIFSVQTPQVFSLELIKKATVHALRSRQVFTDDASCVEAFGATVHTILGSYDNIKITTIEDIALANLIVERRGF